MEERLQKLMSQAGIGSRRDCEVLIEAGRVTVNGRVAILGSKADPATDRVLVDGQPLKLPESHVYIALYKPRGVISAVESPDPRPTVRDLVQVPGHVYPVGRLDVDSEGLILLTDDGDLTNRLTHPRYGHEKEYRVLVAKRPDEDQLDTWRRGVVLEDGYQTLPAQVRIESAMGKGAWLRIILNEGRKRQIRETGMRIGLPVVKIIRIRMGTVTLGSLQPREWRHLSAQEVAELKGETPTVAPARGRNAGRPGGRSSNDRPPSRRPDPRLAGRRFQRDDRRPPERGASDRNASRPDERPTGDRFQRDDRRPDSRRPDDRRPPERGNSDRNAPRPDERPAGDRFQRDDRRPNDRRPDDRRSDDRRPNDQRPSERGAFGRGAPRPDDRPSGERPAGDRFQRGPEQSRSDDRRSEGRRPSGRSAGRTDDRPIGDRFPPDNRRPSERRPARPSSGRPGGGRFRPEDRPPSDRPRRSDDRPQDGERRPQDGGRPQDGDRRPSDRSSGRPASSNRRPSGPPRSGPRRSSPTRPPARRSRR